MVGGDAADLERARPILEKMGANIFHAGSRGRRPNGQDLQQHAAGHLDGRHQRSHCPGRRNGLDPKVLSEIMRRSSGGNWALEKYNPYPA